MYPYLSWSSKPIKKQYMAIRWKPRIAIPIQALSEPMLAYTKRSNAGYYIFVSGKIVFDTGSFGRIVP